MPQNTSPNQDPEVLTDQGLVSLAAGNRPRS